MGRTATNFPAAAACWPRSCLRKTKRESPKRREWLATGWPGKQRNQESICGRAARMQEEKGPRETRELRGSHSHPLALFDLRFPKPLFFGGFLRVSFLSGVLACDQGYHAPEMATTATVRSKKKGTTRTRDNIGGFTFVFVSATARSALGRRRTHKERLAEGGEGGSSPHHLVQAMPSACREMNLKTSRSFHAPFIRYHSKAT